MKLNISGDSLMKQASFAHLGVAVGALLLVEAALWVAVPNPALAAGLDCTKAASNVENMICATPALSTLDGTLNRVYDWALADEYAVNKGRLSADQKNWITQTRNVCTSVDCLTDTYDGRIEELATIKIGEERAASYVSNPADITRITKEMQKALSEVGISQPLSGCSHILSLTSHSSSYGAFCDLGNRKKVEICEESMFGNLAVNFYGFEVSGRSLAVFTQTACPGG
ncbi:lysozyme inhibitor LprI family protein [Rhizobium sp. P44RR-XXIV]|uniref:lysozyme inhibitor LprI family protein n=1 Tax=Rhizobium sp. P44RR-XXIV TaxID=1921145 RepID=UPI0010AB2F99|nr:lysozyme inhibitor LprI family protein [Rhizobium sp. P44RR-XXIV]TIX90772.1 DUF1311 domain-containing protein [Rhizobium sp. P44RR-XXIV]